jgi:hypothetical protein
MPPGGIQPAIPQQARDRRPTPYTTQLPGSACSLLLNLHNAGDKYTRSFGGIKPTRKHYDVEKK